MLLNREEFQAAVKKLQPGMSFDVSKMPQWFEKALVVLEALGEQKSGVDHPLHRGSSRENPVQDLFAQMLPRTVSVVKGFGLNRYMAASKEQDLLFVDRNAAGRILPDEDYYPIESCLASIQVKSKLTRSTVREAAINCISIKKLFGWPSVEEDQVADACAKLCYGVFAYDSDWGLEKLAEVANDEMQEVRREYWPNMFYLLGKGMVIPGEGRGVPLDRSTMFTGSAYMAIGEMGAAPALPPTRAYSFLWFTTNVIDHCLEQRAVVKPPSYVEYWFTTLMMQTQLNRQLQQERERTRSQEQDGKAGHGA